ncbi:hypothetical protein Dcar01_02788 [Deinococcus carri]|uniref:Recombinase domain-containing protein n=1 Tax=Deinococcus carri TaxID=1211323 RepID=A0ABP9W9P9_9DEIO
MTTTLAVGGIRVSTDQQQDRYGPERQRADILREAQRAGLNITEWVEESVSGADDDRSFENNYFRMARTHPGLHVIWSHPNRVGRHVEVTVGIARRLHRLGATVHIAGIGSLRDRRNWKEFLRDAVDAENDYSNIIYNLGKGKFDKARRNLWPEGRQPYGYRLLRDERGQSTTLEPRVEHHAVYTRAQDLCLEGMGCDTIANLFNQEKLPAPREHGKARKSPGWSANPIRRMLRNPRYLGSLVYRSPDGEQTTVTYPALTTLERYQAVCAALEGRRTQRRPRSPFPALFGGHLRCAECGSSMMVQVSRNRDGVPNWARYTCRHHNMRSMRMAREQPLCSHTVRHRVSEFDELAWDTVVASMSDPGVLSQMLTSKLPDVPNHQARIDEIDAEMANILDLVVKYGLPDSAARLRLDPLKAERARLAGEMQVQPPALTQDAEAMAAAFAQHLRRFQTLAERRAALKRWQVCLFLHNGGLVSMKLAVGE